MYLILSYLGSGFLLALPLGPVGVKVLSTLALHGKESSHYAFAGMMVGELVFVVLAIGFYGWQTTMFPQAVTYLHFISAVTMIIFGINLCLPFHLRQKIGAIEEGTNTTVIVSRSENYLFFRQTFLLTIANPMILLIYLSAWTSMCQQFSGESEFALIAMIFFMAGGALWIQFLISMLNRRRKLLLQGYLFASLATGISLVGYGGHLIWQQLI